MSLLEEWKDRWEFAAYNHEQRFQTQLVTKRRFFNALVNLPLRRIQNKLLRPDVPTKGFDAAAFSFADDVFISAGGGQVLRSFVFAYGKNKDFRNVHLTSRALEGFGMMAEAYDPAPVTLGEEIAAGQADVMHALVTESGEASDILDKLVHGQLDMSPGNVTKLEKHLHALAKVCDEKAALSQAFQQQRTANPDATAGGTGVPAKPADYIRDVMRTKEITTPRQAQILSGFVSALLVEAAKPLGTEIYVPQDEIYMKPEDAVALSGFVSSQLESFGFAPNTSLKPGEPRPFEDLPEGAMIKKVTDAQGNFMQYEKVPEAEMLSFANAVHGYLTQQMAAEVEGLLGYVDDHFDKVQASIARSQEDPIPSPIAGNAVPQPQQQAEAVSPDAWQVAEKSTPHRLAEKVERVIKDGLPHLVRPQARHEINKLFGRAIAGTIVSAPFRTFDEVMKSFLRKGKGLDILIEATKTGRVDGEVFNRQDFKQNLQSQGVRLITTPLASSLGVVFTQELYHSPKGISIAAAGRSGKLLAGAMRAGHAHAPQVAGRVAAMTEGMHPSLQALLEDKRYKDEIPRILEAKPEARSEADYRLLGDYYRELSDICVSMAEEALSPYGVGITPERIDSMEDITTRVMRQPVENVPDAMIALAFTESFLNVSADKINSMEYVDPRDIKIKYQDMQKLSDFIAAQAEAAGLVFADGKEDAALQYRNPQTGELEAVPEAVLIRFANVVSHELKRYVDMDGLLTVIRGEDKDEYLKPAEAKVFGNLHFATGTEAESTAEKHAANAGVPDVETLVGAVNESAGNAAQEGSVPAALKHEWKGKVKRDRNGLFKNIRNNLAHPEVQHEIHKLLDRSKGEALSAFFPSILYNSLQHNETIVSRAGLASALYKTFIYPLVYSFGMVGGKETFQEVFMRKRRVVNEANAAQGLAGGAVLTAGMLNRNMRTQIMDANQIDADLMQVQEKPEFRDIPRIAAKPQAERTEEDTQLMQRFVAEAGEKMVGNSASILSALGQKAERGESVETTLERVFAKPVDTMKDAVITLGFLHGIIEENADHLDVLTYISPDEKTLPRRQLKVLAEYMNEQASKAGFAIHGVPIIDKGGKEFALLGQGADLKEGELLQWNEKEQYYERATEQSIIRFANVAAAKFREVAKDRIENPGKQSLAERYQQRTKEDIFTRL